MCVFSYPWQEPEFILAMVFSSNASGCKGAGMLGQSPRLLKVWSTLGDEEPAPLPLGVRVLNNRCVDAGGMKERERGLVTLGINFCGTPNSTPCLN